MSQKNKKQFGVWMDSVNPAAQSNPNKKASDNGACI